MLLGIILVGFGIMLLAGQMASVDTGTLVVRYWPIIVIVYGMLRLFRKNASKTASLILIAFGIIAQLAALNIINGNAGIILVAVALILLGLRVLYATTFEHNARTTVGQVHNDFGSYSGGSAAFEERDVLDDRFIFCSEHRIYKSNTFSGGKVRVDFSNVTIDLKNVWPLDKEINLDVEVSFGKLIVDVPSDWHVIVDGKHCYSHTENGNTSPSSTTLIVRSNVSFGTLRII